LDDLPNWRPPMVPTLIISPHPDDETLAVGGLIRYLCDSKVDVSVAAITDGENAYAGESGLGPVRVLEQERALAELGVPSEKIVRLRMRDSGLHENEADLTEALLALATKGGHIIAPWDGDFHPDHEVCGRSARTVADGIGAKLTYYFFWTWHRGTPSTLDGLDLVAFSVDEDGITRKKRALQCHRSQLQHPSGQPILPSYLLEPMERPYEVFLPA
jgi:LmbE family N-acetylglucosaminyl deacetylase